MGTQLIAYFIWLNKSRKITKLRAVIPIKSHDFFLCWVWTSSQSSNQREASFRWWGDLKHHSSCHSAVNIPYYGHLLTVIMHKEREHSDFKKILGHKVWTDIISRIWSTNKAPFKPGVYRSWVQETGYQTYPYLVPESTDGIVVERPLTRKWRNVF